MESGPLVEKTLSQHPDIHLESGEWRGLEIGWT
jgi:hypothetical protein